MDFGHHHHHRHHRRDEEEEEQHHYYPPPGHRPASPPRYPPPGHHPPPPSYYGGGEEYGRPAYPPVQHVSHVGGYGYDRPPPQVYPPSAAGHYGGSEGGYGSSEGVYGGGELHHRHHYQYDADTEPYSGGVHHVSHESYEGIATPAPARPRQPTVRIYCKAEQNYSLAIREGQVVLARNDPGDEYQHWIKDLRYSTKVKDQDGFPAFSLVNNVTGEAIKHSIGKSHPVRLVRYNPDYLDESVLWTESKDVGGGFRCIRMVNNIGLNFDAFHGDKDHGGVKDGSIIVLWDWCKGDNQVWKIVPY